MQDTQDKLLLIKSLFRGREDVFAIHWEKGNKKGYMPAYFYDPYRYRIHKMNGGTFQNFHDKSYFHLSDDQILKHLNGQHLIGIYPLLSDNTSWFIVADFDKQNWMADCTEFVKLCEEYSIPAYIERSRSGNGGHVWIFFDKPYPAFQSRRIILSLLEKSGAVSAFDKNSSFDRVFPNQDYLSGKGLGNLIALPFYLHSIQNGNSCFLNPQTFVPIQDQWKFLNEIERVTIGHLNLIYQDFAEKENIKPNDHTTGLAITLDNVIQIRKKGAY